MGRILITALFAIAALSLPARGEDADGLAFFESKIRPVLVEHCQQCHSAKALARKKLRGGLRLDTRTGLLEGGDSGPAITPGNAEESLLIQVMNYDDAVQMPPKGKLPDAVLADFRKWIEMGAPDPRVAAESATDPVKPIRQGLSAGQTHWAYRAPRASDPPSVKDESWPNDPVDRYILARLEAKGLTPAHDADRATLARRLYYDLIGLPPTPEAVAEFVADNRPDALEALVDRLLASPRFGERWGRHWLDVARFAESLTLRGFILKEAWRYRDYVIDTFNADRSYDQFLREQIAGDLLPAANLDERRQQLIAISFLSLGNTNLEDQDKEQLRMDVVDEQIDTIGKAFLAQTIGCARCHDHKFDPIPTRDYYALAGIFRNVKTLEHANVSKWLERPLPEAPEREAALKAHEAKVAALQAAIKGRRALLAANSKGKPGVLAAAGLPGIAVDDARATRVGEWKLSQHSGRYIGDGYLHDLDNGKGEKSLTFQPEIPRAGQYEVRLAYSPGGNRSTAVPVTVMSADGETIVKVDMQADPPIDNRFIALGRFRFEANGQGYVLVSNEGTHGHVIADAVVFIPVDQIAADTTTEASPAPAPAAPDMPSISALEAELKRLQKEGPKREMALSIFEEKKIEDARVHVRGNVHNLGAVAPRGFLQAASAGTAAPSMPTTESGRRELAAWLTDPANPLTARVMVNRLWHWLFGAGLVRTTDNFGTTGELPSHPELLDHLALEFRDQGWSIKALVRRLVLTHAYRLSAVGESRARAADPENRLLGRHERHRLDAECLRDTLLRLGGRLESRMGGPRYPETLAADYGYHESGVERSVYAPVFRNALPEIFEVFDFADTSMVMGRRNLSTVAPQALFMLNHPFVIEQARNAAEAILRDFSGDAPQRIERAYQLALGRAPSASERAAILRHLATSRAAPAERWADVFQALFASIEFRYVN